MNGDYLKSCDQTFQKRFKSSDSEATGKRDFPSCMSALFVDPYFPCLLRLLFFVQGKAELDTNH